MACLSARKLELGSFSNQILNKALGDSVLFCSMLVKNLIFSSKEKLLQVNYVYRKKKKLDQQPFSLPG